METGIVLLNFGEPPTPDRDAVEEYLTRIFFANASLEGDTTEEAARKRSRKLAKRRAPDLIEEYEAIDGSPLNKQSREQAEQLEQTLASRGFSIDTYIAMQFTEPYIEDTVRSMLDNDVDRVIGLPVYPLCGPSTTVAALEELATALDNQGFNGEYYEISGWHRHPVYNRIRADNISSYVEKENIDLRADETTLVFSAHGTPQHYLDEGSRYDMYVDEYCE
ncbi:MAG: ferrochelatase, partial [Halobacteriaceae archaeon]